MKRSIAALALLIALPASAVASTHSPWSSSRAGFSPLVPISAFARPAGWLDPSRLQISSSLTVGSGRGRGTEYLQVTSLSYQLAAPLTMRVGLGNAFGPAAAQRGNGMFLESLELAFQGHPAFRIDVRYQDFRSPLQRGWPLDTYWSP